MKKITLKFLVAFLFLGIISTNAQIENFYTFSESTEAYTPLVGADETILMPFTLSTFFVPFDFEYAGKKISFLYFKNRGVLNLGGSNEPQPNDLSEIGQQENFESTSIIAPLWDGGLSIPQNNTTTKRKTLLEGTAPNRRYTVEWENIQWGSSGSAVSFRVIFEETTNNITFLYGPNMSVENQSASIGLNTKFGSSLSFLSITPGATASVSTTIANNAISTSEYPGEGKSYKFTYVPPSCKIPSELIIDQNSLTPFTVEASWVNADTESEWDILVINQNDQTSTTVTATTNPFTLSNLSEDTKYSISIRANCQSNGVSEYSPQLFFTTPAVCPKPLSLATNNITLDSVDFTWTTGDQETAWEVAVIASGDPEPTAGTMVSTTSYNELGLIKDTDYVLYVRADCGVTDGFSKWSTLNFRTLATCNAPTNVTFNNETCSSIDVSWTANNSETSWEILVQNTGNSEEYTVIANTNPFTLQNLNSRRTYRIFVRSICEVDDISRYSNPPAFGRLLRDEELPVAISKNITAELDETGNVTIMASDLDNGSTDNCGISEFLITQSSSFNCSQIGENTVQFVVRDFASNIDFTNAIVTVADNILPQANCVAPFVIQLDESGNATITATDINNGSTDNCFIDILSIDKTTFTTSDIGDNEVTLTIADQSGNISICATTVTIEAAPVSLEDYVTGLSSPRGLAFDTNGDLYIAEHFSGKIFKVTAVETSSEFAATGFRNNNISFDSNGILYTTDDFISQIFQIDSQGSESVYLNSSNGISSPWGITFDTNGNLYYSNQFGGKVIKVTPDLTSSDYATGFFNAEGIAFDSNGNLFIADRSDRKLIKVESDGTQTTVLSGIADIRAVTVDSENNVYFNRTTGSGSSSVVKIIKYNQTDASQIEIISNGLTRVNELVFNKNGDLFIAQDDKVSVIRGVAASEVLSTEEFIENKLAFYPNPVINNLYFSEVVQSLKIYDLSGKKVFESRNSGKDFDISKLASGLYIIEIKNNNQSIVKKMIKDF